ncbi:MAG: hypothetical protein ACRDO4_10720 [Nocardioides sp.]
MTAVTAPVSGPNLPASTVRLARALVLDAKRRGRREENSIEAVARIPLPEDGQR